MTHDYMKSMISYLLNRRDFVSGQELSEALGVSTKTIKRLLITSPHQYRVDDIWDESRGAAHRRHRTHLHGPAEARSAAKATGDDIKIETQGTIGMAFGGTSQDALVTGEFNF